MIRMLYTIRSGARVFGICYMRRTFATSGANLGREGDEGEASVGDDATADALAVVEDAGAARDGAHGPERGEVAAGAEEHEGAPDGRPRLARRQSVRQRRDAQDECREE